MVFQKPRYSRYGIIATPLQSGVEKNYHAQAYVGGLYREQGMGPVNDWLRSLFQLYVQDAYDNMSSEELLQQVPVQPPPAVPRVL